MYLCAAKRTIECECEIAHIPPVQKGHHFPPETRSLFHPMNCSFPCINKQVDSIVSVAFINAECNCKYILCDSKVNVFARGIEYGGKSCSNYLTPISNNREMPGFASLPLMPHGWQRQSEPNHDYFSLLSVFFLFLFWGLSVVVFMR